MQNVLLSDCDLLVEPLATNKTPLSVWIGGVNSQSAIMEMIQHLLKEKASFLSENISVLKSSSFIPQDTNISISNIYVLLPMSPESISLHEDINTYIETELQVLKTMKEGEVAIVPDAYKNYKTNAYIISYADEKHLASHFGIDTQKVSFKHAFLVDALLAMSIEKILFDKIDYEKINAFEV